MRIQHEMPEPRVLTAAAAMPSSAYGAGKEQELHEMVESKRQKAVFVVRARQERTGILYTDRRFIKKPEDALAAARELIRQGGGMTAVKDGAVLHTLRLEVGGLMTKLAAETLTEEAARMKETERSLGITAPENPLLRIVALALPVIPDVKMSDLGLVSVAEQRILPVFL